MDNQDKPIVLHMAKERNNGLAEGQGETREHDAQLVRQFALIQLGAGINFLVGWSLITTALNLLLYPSLSLTGLTGWSVLFEPSYLIPIYIAVGIVYSIMATLRSKPKRLLSPLHIQFATMPYYMILLWYVARVEGYSPVTTILSGVLVYGVIGFVLFSAIGLGQTTIVRSIVGLNGSKQDVVVSRLLLDAKLDSVLACDQRGDLDVIPRNV